MASSGDGLWKKFKGAYKWIQGGQTHVSEADVEASELVPTRSQQQSNGNGNSESLAGNLFRDTGAHNFASIGDTNRCIQFFNLPGTDINLQGNNGMTVLHLAAKKGHSELLRVLLSRGADKYIQDVDGLLPLHFAIYHRKFDCVRLLTDGCQKDDPQFNTKTIINGKTALMEAAESGSLANCRLVVGNNIDDVDKKGQTALFYAVKGEHKDVTEYLISIGASPTKQHDKCKTPMHEAAKHKSRVFLQLFFESVDGDDVFQVDSRGRGILHFAVTQNDGDCLEYLLGKECVRPYIDRSFGDEGTPLLYAMHCNSSTAIFRLLEAGADIMAEYKGTYPIHKAAQLGKTAIVEKLLEMNPELLFQENGNAQTPLHVAAMGGGKSSTATVSFLIVKIRLAKLSPSAVDKNKQTALHLAMKRGNKQLINVLLDSVSAGIQDVNGFTALHLAAELGNADICEILVKNAPSNLFKSSKGDKFFPLDCAFQKIEKNEKAIIYLLKASSSTGQKKVPHYFKNDIKERMKKYMEKALDKKLRTVVSAIISSSLWDASLFGGDKRKPENFKDMLQLYPDLAMKVLTKCIDSKSEENPVYTFNQFEETYYITGENSAFDENGNLKKDAKSHDTNVHSWAENHAVTLMINNNETNLLKHPNTQAWLKRKWRKYIRQVHSFLLFLEGLYLVAIIGLMSTTWNWFHIKHEYNITKDEFCDAAQQMDGDENAIKDNRTMDQSTAEVFVKFDERVASYAVFYHFLVITWTIKVMLEIFYIIRLRRLYWAFDMLPQAVIVIFQLMFTMILIFAPIGICYQKHPGFLQEIFVWQCGIFSVLFAWLHLINSINQAFTSVFLPITKDFLEILLKVIYFLIYFILIFAFIFYLLLREKKAFSSVHQSLATTIVWMLLDLGYTDTFVEDELNYPIMSNILFFIFITTIGALIVSLINKERNVKSKGKALDDDYRRLVIYARLIFRYDICFSTLRRYFAVNKLVGHKKVSLIEYYLGEIENNEEQNEDDHNNDIVERIDKLDNKLNELSDHVTDILTKISLILDRENKQEVIA